MAFNYNNPYQSYNQNYVYQQPYNQYPQYQQPTQMYQTYQPQVVYHPLTYINGIEGAKTFIVNPNQTFYLMDSDSNTLYVKTADAQGKCDLKAFVLSSAENNPHNQQKADLHSLNYVTKEDLNIFKEEIINAIKGVGVNEQSN